MNEKNQNKSKKGLDGFFGISKLGSSIRVEIIAGIATFLAMAYILIVNPNSILYSTHTPELQALWSQVFIATALGAVVGTLLMSLFAKMPLAQASGMGLNSTVGGVWGGGVSALSTLYAYTLENALLLVLISGIIFLILSVVPIGKNKETGKLVSLREKIFDGMPTAVRKAITVGIGLFIAFIGMQNAGVIQDNPYTLVSFVDFRPMFQGQITNGSGALLPWVTTLVCFIGLAAIAIFKHFNSKGAVVWGILIATVVYSLFDLSNWSVLAGKGGISWKFWENLGAYFSKDGIFAGALIRGWDMPSGSIFTSIVLVITFCMIDMFDTMGTVVGCCTNAGLVDENGKPLNYNKIMVSDSVATVAGAVLGTSTVTTFVESGAGVAAGGKTGFSSLITAILFFLSIFLLPVFAFIPSCAAAAALIYVGVLMMGNVKDIDFHDVRNAVPAFLTIIMMVLTYSITNGIGIGVISYVCVNIICWIVDMIKWAANKKQGEKPVWNVSVVSIVVTLLFVVYFCVPMA